LWPRKEGLNVLGIIQHGESSRPDKP
jgi:hypothetical protein